MTILFERSQSVKRVRTPSCIQMEATECGAACLNMILAYHRRYVPLSELRIACGVSRDGCNAHDILEAGEAYGLEGAGYSLSVDELMETQGPLIIFWEFNHFVVYEGVQGNTVYLNDPAIGPREVPLEQFPRSYTGVALELLPGPDFKSGGQQPSLMGMIWERVGNEWPTFSFLLTVGLLLAFVRLCYGGAVQFFLDQLYPVTGESFTQGLAAVVVVILFSELLLNAVQGLYLARFGVKLRIRLACEFFWKLLRMPMRFYDQRHSGEMAYRMTLTEVVAETLSGQLATVLVRLCLVGVYITLILYCDLWIGLMALTTFVLNLWMHRYFHEKRKCAYARIAQESGKYQTSAISGILSVETVKAGGREGRYFDRLVGLHARVINAQQKLKHYDALLIAGTEMLVNFALLTLLVTGAWRVLEGSMTVGLLYFLKILLDGLTAPMVQLAMLSDEMQVLEINMQRTEDVLSSHTDPNVDRNLAHAPDDVVKQFHEQPQLSGSMVVKNLSFGYASKAEPLIEDLSLSVDAGSLVVVTGSAGCGKSTLLRLLSGLYEPWSGTIAFDGLDMKALPRELVSNTVTLVRQKPFLFKASVRDNLTVFDRAMPDTFVREATETCAIHNVIMHRPRDYDGAVLEQGANYSGGQRQRLEIARALARKPRLLLIDEGTSGLQESLEVELLQKIKQQGIACLVVTYRMGLMAVADQILIMHQGKIIQRGVHDKLSQKPGPYQELIKQRQVG